MNNPPGRVAILGLGPSLLSFVDMTKALGGRSAEYDQVWGVNAVGNVIDCDLIFHMDDVRIQELRAHENPNGNIANMLRWMRTTDKPIMTSRAHPDYPSLIEFPLEEVIRDLDSWYFNSTVAYAVAYAIYIGVKSISLWGVDFTYENSHHAEKGRACVEYYLGVAKARGIEIGVPDTSSLMDATEDENSLYGYDTVDVEINRESGAVTFHPRDEIPTASDIEKRYDHTRHVNPLVERAIK